MGITAEDARIFLENRLGLSKGNADAAVELANWADTTITVVGWVNTAYEFYKNFMSDGDQIWNDLLAIMNTVALHQTVDNLSDLKNSVRNPLAAISVAREKLDAYQYEPTQQVINELYDNSLGYPDSSLQAQLLTYLQGLTYRFMPLAYADPKIPDWVNGRNVPGQFFHQNEWGGWVPFTMDVQVYQSINLQVSQPDKLLPFPAPDSNQLPALLRKDYPRNWDGLLCLTLILAAFPPWLSALAALEPFYRTTGYWLPQIADMSKWMNAFKTNWSNAELLTREMPTGSEAFAEFGHPGAGFESWPCGALDPIMGVETTIKNWWKTSKTQIVSSGLGQTETVPAGDYLTSQERLEFEQQRLIQRQKLEDKSGYTAFARIVAQVDELKIPPSYSPTLQVDPKLLSIKYPGLSARSKLKFEEVHDALGTPWTGQIVQSSVTATIPISVQPNPKPVGDLTRATSDVVFGYEITVRPNGGDKQSIKDWIWPLRLNKPWPSLYHDQSGVDIKLPYSKSHPFSKLKSDTWQTITDGSDRYWRDVTHGDSIAFTMTVTVDDAAISIKIDADETANKGRSFGLTVEVKETVAVDANGDHLKKDNKGYPITTNAKTYVRAIQIPVDIYRIYVPGGYFDATVGTELSKLFHISQNFGIPGPHPDKDPVLELSLWRMVLETNPVLLQAYTHDLRLSIGRPSLMPKQVLAQLDKALSTLAEQKLSQPNTFLRGP